MTELFPKTGSFAGASMTATDTEARPVKRSPATAPVGAATRPTEAKTGGAPQLGQTTTTRADATMSTSETFEVKTELYGNGRPRRVVIRGKISSG